MIPFPQSSPLLRRRGVEVSNRGEHVVLQIGNTPITIRYDHALALSQWMREEASDLKEMLTGGGKTMRSLGLLNQPDAPPSAPASRGVAIHVRPTLYDFRRGDVSIDGRLIRIKIGQHTMHLPYEAALTIAQWLRAHGKVARNRACDTRHWSEIVEDENAALGVG